MDLLDELNILWIDIFCSFLMLSFCFFVGVLIWQNYKNKREQAKILAHYKHNLQILQELHNRFLSLN